MTEADLLAIMRAAPDDRGPRLVYADWLSERGDPRGELVVLDEAERAGALVTRAELAQLDRLLELASERGFPALPDDPCADILDWRGGGSHPTQYDLDYEGHSYYLRWREGFAIDVDDETVLECDLDVLASNDWTFFETTAILAIVSAAIRRGTPLSTLSFPVDGGIRTHPRYHLGRAPSYVFPDGLYPEHRVLEVRDFARWHALWHRRQLLAGQSPAPIREPGCRCGVAGLSCGASGCHFDSWL